MTRLIVNDTTFLSPLETGDVPALVEHLADRAIYEQTSRIPFPYTAEDANQFLGYVADETKKIGVPMCWAIRQADGGLIGVCGLDGIAQWQHHRAEIGYWLARPYWGCGIMTAVTQRLCAHAFSELHLAKLTANVFSTNPASARVLEKCGFRQEATLRDHIRKDDRVFDLWVYSLWRE